MLSCDINIDSQELFIHFLGLLPQLVGVAPEKAIKLTVSLQGLFFYFQTTGQYRKKV